MVLELTTGGFYAEPQDDGTVEITIPDFGELDEAGSPSMPVKRTWVEAIAGRKVKLVSVEARSVEVAIEDVFAEFGFGETTPQAVKDFLSYAYHNWDPPSPRYVVLLGDATYDYKDYMKTGVSNRVPPLMVKASYLWTTSDPTYASVNGEDLLPDLAIGRLPAATVDEARTMVEKIVAYETGDVSLDGLTVLIADNADRAGDFHADAEELASGVLAGRDLRKVYLSELGTGGTRDAILQSFDEGASLMSYLGHGGIHLWASENLLNTSQVGSLSPQTQQPILLTMNCLNGYYHFPFFNSLSEELLKADGNGAVAAFSPSGLSLKHAGPRLPPSSTARAPQRKSRSVG